MGQGRLQQLEEQLELVGSLVDMAFEPGGSQDSDELATTYATSPSGSSTMAGSASTPRALLGLVSARRRHRQHVRPDCCSACTQVLLPRRLPGLCARARAAPAQRRWHLPRANIGGEFGLEAEDPGLAGDPKRRLAGAPIGHRHHARLCARAERQPPRSPTSAPATAARSICEARCSELRDSDVVCLRAPKDTEAATR